MIPLKAPRILNPRNIVNRMEQAHCLFTLIGCLIVVVCTAAGVIMNLTTIYDENFDHMGIRTFCMFTVNSKILAAAGMFMVLPYAVDGLRMKNWRLPRWLVVFVFSGVTCVALTFLVSLFLLSPVKGFVLIFTGSRFFLHGVCPLLCAAAFCLAISDRPLSGKDTVYAVIPVLIYAGLYFVMVVVIGEKHGGWRDFYGVTTRVPVWIPAILITPLTWGIATLLRLAHNHSCVKRLQYKAELYRQVLGNADVREIVREMGRSARLSNLSRSIVVPCRVIDLLIATEKRGRSREELCRVYPDAWLSAGNEKTKG